MLLPGSKPDLVLWTKQGRDYLYHDGLRRVVRVGNQWRPEVRESLESPWKPAFTFRQGGAFHYSTLTIAQQEAIKRVI